MRPLRYHFNSQGTSSVPYSSGLLDFTPPLAALIVITTSVWRGLLMLRTVDVVFISLCCVSLLPLLHVFEYIYRYTSFTEPYSFFAPLICCTGTGTVGCRCHNNPWLLG